MMGSEFPKADPSSGLLIAIQGIILVLFGVIGMVVPLDASETGADVREVIREEGRKDREVINALAKSQEVMGDGIKEAVREVGRENREARKENREAPLDDMLPLEPGDLENRKTRKENREALASVYKVLETTSSENREALASVYKVLERISASQDRRESSYDRME